MSTVVKEEDYVPLDTVNNNPSALAATLKENKLKFRVISYL
jgi:hypothetical protein